MAETTRPARARRTAATAKPASKPTAAKTAPAPAPAPAAAQTATATDGVITLEIPYVGDTARYSKFVVPESYKGTLAGTIYAPLGTSRVLLKVIAEEAPETPAE